MPLKFTKSRPRRAVATAMFSTTCLFSASLSASAGQLPQNAAPIHYNLTIRPDAAALKFSAEEKIEVKVRTATTEIVLNAANLEIAQTTLTDRSGRNLPGITVRLDDGDQTLHVLSPRKLLPGKYTLSFRYAGKVQQNGSGLFALDERGKRFLFTQFEPTDARRLMPSWDEPSFKATFSLAAVIPDGASAISNSPIAADETANFGFHRVTFATTPRMATYLLFLGVGDLERATQKVGNVDLGVVTRRGAVSQAQFALESAAQILPWYSKYFDFAYPLPKLDNVAGPGESLTYGAMENWGAIFSFERDFLIDPTDHSARQRERVFTTVAHEIAHQWTGNLVTMRWWDDLWLNEGLASWLEHEADRKFHPEWSADLTYMRGRDLAMEADALETTHPVVQPVPVGGKALEQFDFITYFKGEATVRMLEAYVGSEAWREGLRRYVARHAYGNATSQDLWKAVDAASQRPVDQIANDMTRKAGLPLVVASSVCRGGRAEITLTQRRVHSDGRSDKGPGWILPVIVGHPDGETRQALLHDSLKTSLAGCGPVVVNLGQKGYFRTAYSPSMVRELGKAFATLSPVDQLGLLSDSAALGLSGAYAMTPLAELIDGIDENTPTAVVADALSRWKTLFSFSADDSAERVQLRQFAKDVFLPKLDSLGWEPRSHESDQDANLRDQLISTMGAAGVPDVLQAARQRFETSGQHPPREAILLAISSNATADEWERLLALAVDAKSPQVRSRFFAMLGRAEDENLAMKALTLSLSDDVNPTAAPTIVETVAVRHPQLALNFALRNQEILTKRLDSFSSKTFYAELADQAQDTDALNAVAAYCNNSDASEVQSACRSTIASINDRIRVRTQRMPELYRWLSTRAESANLPASRRDRGS